MGKTDKLFAAMKGDHDLMRAKQEQARPRDMTELQENQQHYTNLLRLARTADLSDIHRQQIVYIAGVLCFLVCVRLVVCVWLLESLTLELSLVCLCFACFSLSSSDSLLCFRKHVCFFLSSFRGLSHVCIVCLCRQGRVWAHGCRCDRKTPQHKNGAIAVKRSRIFSLIIPCVVSHRVKCHFKCLSFFLLFSNS